MTSTENQELCRSSHVELSRTRAESKGNFLEKMDESEGSSINVTNNIEESYADERSINRYGSPIARRADRNAELPGTFRVRSRVVSFVHFNSNPWHYTKWCHIIKSSSFLFCADLPVQKYVLWENWKISRMCLSWCRFEVHGDLRLWQFCEALQKEQGIICSSCKYCSKSATF